MDKNQEKRFKVIIICAILCLIVIFTGLFYLIVRELHREDNLAQSVLLENETQEYFEEDQEEELEENQEEDQEDIAVLTDNDENINDDYEDKNLDTKFIKYYQGDYGDIPWCSGNVADCGSSVTSMAMVFTNLLQKEITPKHTATWCKSTDYYVKHVGMSLAYINASTAYFNRATGSNIKCRETYDIEEVYNEVKNGALCISLQVEGRFTATNHFIVLSRNIQRW